NRRPGGIARYGSMPQRGATRLYGPRHSAPWPRDRPSGRKGLAQGAHHGVSRERRRAREWRNDPEKPLAERFRKLTRRYRRCVFTTSMIPPPPLWSTILTEILHRPLSSSD